MKILILHAHPKRQASVVQHAMLKAVSGLEGITLVDLYAAYPDFGIDVRAERS